MKQMVHWDDEENGESEMDPFEEASELDVSDDEQSNDEEPRIKDVLENVSKAVSRERASDLLHSMAASKDILFWTPRGQILRKNRTIPVTNITELVEYILLPHNDEVIKPRALKGPFSLTVMHRGRFVVSGTQKVAIRVSSFSDGEICFHLNSLFML